MANVIWRERGRRFPKVVNSPKTQKEHSTFRPASLDVWQYKNKQKKRTKENKTKTHQKPKTTLNVLKCVVVFSFFKTRKTRTYRYMLLVVHTTDSSTLNKCYPHLGKLLGVLLFTFTHQSWVSQIYGLQEKNSTEKYWLLQWIYYFYFK